MIAQLDLHFDGRRAKDPPSDSRCAGNRAAAPQLRPLRLQRSKAKTRSTPPGATYVGRPTLWANPFAGRYHLGQARSTILFAAWLAGDCSPRVLRAAHFSRAEIASLGRRRIRVLAHLPELAGRNLQCWCPLTSAWCHADVLLRVANPACGYGEGSRLQ